LSQNPSTPPATLLYLASDENWAVRQTVSCNICAPAKALQKLAFDQDAGVREAVIQNPNTPPSLLTAMYYDMVQKDALSEWLAIAFIRKNFLPQTELCALVALFGQRVAEVIADNIAVAKGSALEKTLLLRGFKINKRPRIKERNKLH